MPTTFSSNLVYFKVSTVSVADALAGTGLTVTCLVSFDENYSANVAEKATMHCGTIKTVGSPSISFSGNGGIAGDLAGTEVSAQGIKAYVQDRTRLYFAVTNSSSGTIAANEVVYATGEGYFNSVNPHYAADEIADFDFEFAADGTVDLAP